MLLLGGAAYVKLGFVSPVSETAQTAGGRSRVKNKVFFAVGRKPWGNSKARSQ
jgi:hypothetical protein